jgi:hypothetical protein
MIQFGVQETSGAMWDTANHVRMQSLKDGGMKTPSLSERGIYIYVFASLAFDYVSKVLTSC